MLIMVNISICTSIKTAEDQVLHMLRSLKAEQKSIDWFLYDDNFGV